MKNGILPLLFCGGLLLAAIAITSYKDEAPPPSLLNDLLEAHKVLQNPDALDAFEAQATRAAYSEILGVESSYVPRRVVRIWSKDNVFKRSIGSPNKPREQRDLFDGEFIYRLKIENGRVVEPIRQLDDAEFSGAKFSMMTFGLVTVLKQLRHATVERAQLKQTEQEQDRLEVKTASGEWTLYLDDNHLISKIEMIRKQRRITLEYYDYRWVDGVQLPFAQRISANGDTVFEYSFDRIGLNPPLPEDCFDLESLSK